MNKIKTLTVCGPTASGKTSLGISLAKEFDGQIISADSIQIYKSIDIASAKPTICEMQGIKHYLIDFLDPNESYSVARFIDDANNAVDEITANGKLPIIVGGTGLYIDSLLNNIKLLDNTYDPEIRKKINNKLEKCGSDALYQELMSVDPQAAEKIHPNNAVKVLRALEIYYTSGNTLTEQNEQSLSEPSKFDNTTVFLNCENRDFLYDRINKRVDIMMENGLLFEAEQYYNNYYSSTSSQAIGYKELKPYIDKQASLEECVENLKKSTRNYAKRQLTWFRRNKEALVFYIDKYSSSEELAKDVIRTLKDNFS